MPPSNQHPLVAVVAGAHGGLGSAFVRYLLARNFLVVGGVRRPVASNGSDILYSYLDLSKREGVRDFCQYVRNTVPSIHLLILNGATLSNHNSLIQVNALSHAYIAHDLADRLHDNGRIVTVSSGDGELLWFSSSLQSKLNHAATLKSFPSWHAYISSQFRAHQPEDNEHIDNHIHGDQKQYKLSKAILNSFVRTFEKTPCFAVCPGDVDTPMLDANINQDPIGANHSVISPDEAVLWMKDMLNPEVDGRTFHGKFWRYGQSISW